MHRQLVFAQCVQWLSSYIKEHFLKATCATLNADGSTPLGRVESFPAKQSLISMDWIELNWIELTQPPDKINVD